MDNSLIKKLVDIGTDYNTAVHIVEILANGWYPRGLTVRQAIVIGWL
jgi:hypothetical protein